MLLCSLHDAIQIAMGWTNTHGHEFQNDTSRNHYTFEDLDENRVQLGTVLKSVDDSMIYVYDFGDNWRHQVRLSKILPMDEVSKGRPICLAGERRCPPEDIGGVNAYYELMEAIFDPDPRQTYKQFNAWTNGKFQPNEFDLRAVNENLSQMT
jgi:hypothetical protein